MEGASELLGFLILSASVLGFWLLLSPLFIYACLRNFKRQSHADNLEFLGEIRKIAGNGNHFKEEGVDDLYKLEWVSMVVYALLKVEQLKAEIHGWAVTTDDLVQLSKEAAMEYLLQQAKNKETIDD